MNRNLLEVNDLFETPVRSESVLHAKSQKSLDSDSEFTPGSSRNAGTYVTPYIFDKVSTY